GAPLYRYETVWGNTPGNTPRPPPIPPGSTAQAPAPATCLASDAAGVWRCWLGTKEGGVFRSTDQGESWAWSGLAGEHVTALAADPSRRDLLWAGTEPSTLWRLADEGDAWERRPGLAELPSSSEWAFPPRPETHHVRWIACHPHEPGRLWLAIEAGALVRTPDGGATWRDRVPGGPRDTHELAIHPDAPATLRVSAGDGYFESHDGGESWAQPQEGLDVRYLRSVAIDPGDDGVVLVSAASRPRSAYVAGKSDGRLYRREGTGPWAPVTDGWPDPPQTIAPLLLAGSAPGELWAADERGLHRSGDGGRTWEIAAAFPDTPHNLRGLAIVG
ncbi:MAG: hypothetical protein R3266_05795, partial [Gemmatimonadota bacterium]|nr:hypothetical protein [Gemmatimonadota bacterium]